MSGVLVWPAYRRGFYVTKDEKTQWPEKFDWKVSVGTPKGLRMGWFGSLESAYMWIYKQQLDKE